MALTAADLYSVVFSDLQQWKWLNIVTNAPALTYVVSTLSLTQAWFVILLSHTTKRTPNDASFFSLFFPIPPTTRNYNGGFCESYSEKQAGVNQKLRSRHIRNKTLLQENMCFKCLVYFSLITFSAALTYMLSETEREREIITIGSPEFHSSNHLSLRENITFSTRRSAARPHFLLCLSFLWCHKGIHQTDKFNPASDGMWF